MPAVNNAIFTNVARQNHLGFYDGGQLREKRVIDFLNFTQNDVAKATGVPKASVRYDARMPDEMKQRILEIANVCELVAEYFRGDVGKTALWFQFPNPLLGNMPPRDMIRFGRYKKLVKFILNAKAGHAA